MAHAHAVNCGNSSCDLCYPTPGDILDALNADDYRLGDLQAIPYLPGNPAYAPLFADNFLSTLYLRSRDDHILDRVFTGMQILHHDVIVNYLTTRPLTILGRWRTDASGRDLSLDPLGYSFIVNWIGTPYPHPGPRNAFGAYGFFRESWGTPDQELVAMLGLARMFRIYRLGSLFGQRYAWNGLTARFMEKFGFRDIGSVPEFLLQRDERAESGWSLVDGVVSRLRREDLVRFVEDKLISLV